MTFRPGERKEVGKRCSSISRLVISKFVPSLVIHDSVLYPTKGFAPNIMPFVQAVKSFNSCRK